MDSSMPFAENNQLPQFIQEYAALLRNRIVAINETMGKIQAAIVASISIEVPSGAELVVDDSNNAAQLLCRVRLPRQAKDSQTGTIVWDVTLEVAEQIARSVADMRRISAINTIIPHLVNYFASRPELVAGAYQDTSGLRIVFTPFDFPQQVGALVAVPRTSFGKSPDDNSNCWYVISEGRQIDTGYLPIYKPFYLNETTAGAWSFLLDLPRMIVPDGILDIAGEYQCHIVDEHNQLLGYQHFSASHAESGTSSGRMRASLPLTPSSLSLQIMTDADFADIAPDIEEKIAVNELTEIASSIELSTTLAANTLPLVKLLFPALRNAVWLLNEQGIIVNVNPIFAARLGYLPVEMIGCRQRKFLAPCGLDTQKVTLSDTPYVFFRKIDFSDHQADSFSAAVEITAFSQGELWLAHQLLSSDLRETVVSPLPETFPMIFVEESPVDTIEAALSSQMIPELAESIKENLTLESQKVTLDEQILPEVVYKGARLQRFMAKLLEIARLEAGLLPIAKRKFDIHPLLLNCVAAQQGKFSEKALQLQVDICKAPLLIMGDSKRLAQIIELLLENALHFTEKGSVTLTARRDVNMLHLVVADTGIGVASELCERVFDGFIYANVNVAGDGLGLRLVRLLVQAHGGEVWLTSSGSGHGCTVSIRLPLLPVMPAASASSAA